MAFADADFRLHPETFNYIDSVMQHPGYAGGATGITMERWSLGISATWYMIMPPLWLYGIDGGVWFCRRDDFQEIGGYDETVPLGEDVEFLRRLKRLGQAVGPSRSSPPGSPPGRSGSRPPLVLNSSRKWDKHGDWHMFPDVVRASVLSAVCPPSTEGLCPAILVRGPDITEKVMQEGCCVMKQAHLILSVLLWIGYTGTAPGLPPDRAPRSSTTVSATVPSLHLDNGAAQAAFRIAMGDLLGNVALFKDGLLDCPCR